MSRRAGYKSLPTCIFQRWHYGTVNSWEQLSSATAHTSNQATRIFLRVSGLRSLLSFSNSWMRTLRGISSFLFFGGGGGTNVAFWAVSSVVSPCVTLLWSSMLSGEMNLIVQLEQVDCGPQVLTQVLTASSRQSVVSAPRRPRDARRLARWRRLKSDTALILIWAALDSSLAQFNASLAIVSPQKARNPKRPA